MSDARDSSVDFVQDPDGRRQIVLTGKVARKFRRVIRNLEDQLGRQVSGDEALRILTEHAISKLEAENAGVRASAANDSAE